MRVYNRGRCNSTLAPPGVRIGRSVAEECDSRSRFVQHYLVQDLYTRMVVRWLLIVAGWTLLGPRTRVTANGGLVLPSGTAGLQTADGAATSKLNSSCEKDEKCINLVKDSVCNLTTKLCECATSHPVNIGLERCVVARNLNESCEFKEQCTFKTKMSICSEGVCICQHPHKMTNGTDGELHCKSGIEDKKTTASPDTGVDPTMLAVLISLVVMFIIMCIVLRMFSKAQFRDQRTIFNSPRLMKKSLSKARAERRSSHASIGSRAGSRAGSRQASIQSGLNLAGTSPKHSPRGSRESFTLPNSNSMKHHPAPVAKDDDDAVVKIGSPTKSDDSPHVAIKISDNNITAV